MSEGSYIVADFGKTHAKLTLWSRDGQCLRRETRANARPDAAPYLPLDVSGITEWLLTSLPKFADQPVEAIIPVSHGAAVAGIRAGTPAFLPLDYEWEIPDAIVADYFTQRDPFTTTGSPAYPMGLNFGAQLHYLHSQGQLEGTSLLPYAQYWAWLFSGVAVSEVTSLGCHSDLWAPAAHSFSSMAKQRGWAAQFAPMAKAGDVIGTLQPEIARRTGLSPHIRIHAGLHDSNAALVAARGFAEIANKEATVLSTGTWFVAMKSGGHIPMPLAEARDCLINVDVEGKAVPSARFMGGREIEVLEARIDVPGLDGLHSAISSGAMILPSHVQGSGPFPADQGRWINEPSDPATRCATVALYAALMADTMLGLIGAHSILLIEGRFAASEIFTRALASLRPDMAIYTTEAEADVSFGALRMIDPGLKPSSGLSEVTPLEIDLTDYRTQWTSLVEGKNA